MGRTREVRISEEEPKSSLSPNVQRLLCEDGVPNLEDRGSCDESHSPFLSWDALKNILPDRNSFSDETDYFRCSVQKMAPVFTEVHQCVKRMTFEEFCLQYEHFLRWTDCVQAFQDCFRMLKDDETGVNSLLSMLLSTSTLEKALGDVYLTKGEQCPNMLKDLLATTEIQEIFGTVVMDLLRVILGPPTSLNLRNILWHGFPLPGELPEQYAYFLIILTASLGKILMTSPSFTQNEIPHRSSVTFPQMTELDSVFPELDHNRLAIIRDIFHRSDFIKPSTQPVWCFLLDKFARGLHGQCVVLLLPQLEFSLRRLFVTVNGCPNRLLTAESTVLFTTFSEILQKRLPDGQENRIYEVLGDRMMTLLLDLLVYPKGPRVRDRISHGETDIATLPRNLAGYLISMVAAISALFLPPCELSKSPVVISLLDSIENYECRFHPNALLKKQIMKVAEGLSDLASVPRASEEQSGVASWKNFSENDLKAQPHYNVIEGIFSEMKTPISSQQKLSFSQPFSDITLTVSKILESLFASLSSDPLYNSVDGADSDSAIYQYRTEVLGVLRRISAQIQDVIIQLTEILIERYAQWTRKLLSSRRRKNYLSLLEGVPMISVGVRTALVVVLHEVCTLLLHEGSTLAPAVLTNEKTRVANIKLLKSVLQYSENLASLTNARNNKWDSACCLSGGFIENMRKRHCAAK